MFIVFVFCLRVCAWLYSLLQPYLYISLILPNSFLDNFRIRLIFELLKAIKDDLSIYIYKKRKKKERKLLNKWSLLIVGVRCRMLVETSAVLIIILNSLENVRL